MAVWNPRANEIFLNAVEIDTHQECHRYLEAICAGDDALRQAVEALLQTHAEAGSFLDQPAPCIQAEATRAPLPSAGVNSAVTEQADAVIAGRYKLQQTIGEGGMGTVWLAQQTEPMRRQVALKLIKAGMDSGQVLARFEAERQALALMDHPNIAKVLDAGATADGRPFFVMELVKGIPITRFSEDNQLTIRQRLELMGLVCQAVQHAHQKGIIHRDLKPSNVLVACYDGKPVPKVIDFGVAKATGQPLTERTFFTGFGSIVGTLEYMSPEQAEFNALDIDTRSDIYSLGVLMYELLTGTTPLTRERVKRTALGEVLSMIREEDPPKPSTRLSEAQDNQGSMSQERRALAMKMVRGELDWIVMKALDKDRNRRYETANSLAQDIDHYLKDEPVWAGPPSMLYRCRKFVKRNRGMVLAASVVLLAILCGIAGTTWGLVEARSQRDQAEVASVKESLQRRAAVEQSDLYKKEKTKADQLRMRAEQAEEDARKRLREVQQTLFTAQLARVATLWQSDPAQARELLRDYKACPPTARDFAWYYFHRLCETHPAFGQPNRDPGNKPVPAQTEAITLVDHEDSIHALTFSLDGKHFAWVGMDHSVRLWDTHNEKTIDLGRLPERAACVAFSADGRTVFVGTAQSDKGKKEGRIVRLDAATGKGLTPWSGHVDPVTVLAAAPRHPLLASASTGVVKLWDLAAEKEIGGLDLGDGWTVYALAFHPDGKMLAGLTRHWLIVWDIDQRDLKERHRIPRPWGGAVPTAVDRPTSKAADGLAFTTNGKGLVCNSHSEVVFLDLVKYQPETLVRLTKSYITALALTPDDNTLAVGLADRTIQFWDIPSKQLHATLAEPKSGGAAREIHALAFSPNGKTLAFGDRSRELAHGSRGAIKLWRAAPLRPIGHNSVPYLLQFTPSGDKLLSSSRESHILWDSASGTELGSWTKEHETIISWLTPDGRRVLSMGQDKTVRLQEVLTGAELCRRPWSGNLHKPYFCDGALVALLNPGQSLDYFDLETLEPVKSRLTPKEARSTVILSLDGRSLAAFADGKPLMRNLETQEERTFSCDPHSPGYPHSFLGNDRLLLLQRPDTMKVVDVNTGKELLMLHQAGSRVLAVSADGQTLAVASQGAGDAPKWEVRLWNLATGKQRCDPVLLPKTTLLAMVVTPDGHLIIATDDGAAVKFWPRVRYR
jgi:eukaryotic-like serine/threonine-protein kinase